MKLNCLSCLNENQEKFTTTKKGFVCLVCFEKSVNKTTENQVEIAQIELEKHLARPTGGNNRRFTRAYMGMKNKLAFLENLPDKTEGQKNFMLGYREAVSTFENESK